MLQVRDTTSDVGGHCAANVLAAVGEIATWRHSLFDGDSRALNRWLELSIISLNLTSYLWLKIHFKLVEPVDDLIRAFERCKTLLNTRVSVSTVLFLQLRDEGSLVGKNGRLRVLLRHELIQSG